MPPPEMAPFFIALALYLALVLAIHGLNDRKK